VVETFFKRSCTIHRLRQGPLAGHIDLLADRLAAQGFSRVHSLDIATPRFVWALHRAQTAWPRHVNESAKFTYQDVCRSWMTAHPDTICTRVPCKTSDNAALDRASTLEHIWGQLEFRCRKRQLSFGSRKSFFSTEDQDKSRISIRRRSCFCFRSAVCARWLSASLSRPLPSNLDSMS